MEAQIPGLTAMALGFEPRQRAVGTAAAASESSPDLQAPPCLPVLISWAPRTRLCPRSRCPHSWHRTDVWARLEEDYTSFLEVRRGGAGPKGAGSG